MHKSLLALLGAAATLTFASDVADLKTATFKEFVTENDLVLAEFFAPWCGHCKALAPEYEEAATSLKEKDIRLAKVDCTEEADLCQEFGVEGYPTLKVFRGYNKHAPYGGPRKADAIVSYMTKQSMPAVTLLDSKTLDDFKTADKVVVVGYFAADDKTSNKTFDAVAEAMREDFVFGATSDPALAKAEGIKVPGVVLYKSFDEGKNIFDGTFSDEAITKFAKVNSVPLVGEVGPETYSTYMAAGIPLAYIFAESAEERQSYATEFADLATKYKGKLNFATIDAASFGQHAGNLNLKQEWPAFAIQDTTDNKKYPYSQDEKFSTKNIAKFVDDFVAGKLEPSIKSDPIPEDNNGPVTIVVAKNYEDIVMDDKKDVLVEFYAPWCGHCKALAPKYEELGELFRSVTDKITVAKVDATTNDVPIEIQGFPTLKLFKAGSKAEPVEYTGDRTIEDLAAFIKKEGTHKIDGYSLSAGGKGSSLKDDIAKATEGMPQQAMAASETAESVGGKVKSAIKEAASAVKTAVIDDDDSLDEHDEL